MTTINIEEVENHVTYKQGDVFLVGSDYTEATLYILAQIGLDKDSNSLAALISLKDGNRLRGFKSVKHIRKITQEEMDSIKPENWTFTKVSTVNITYEV